MAAKKQHAKAVDLLFTRVLLNYIYNHYDLTPNKLAIEIPKRRYGGDCKLRSVHRWEKLEKAINQKDLNNLYCIFPDIIFIVKHPIFHLLQPNNIRRSPFQIKSFTLPGKDDKSIIFQDLLNNSITTKNNKQYWSFIGNGSDPLDKSSYVIEFQDVDGLRSMGGINALTSLLTLIRIHECDSTTTLSEIQSAANKYVSTIQDILPTTLNTPYFDNCIELLENSIKDLLYFHYGDPQISTGRNSNHSLSDANPMFLRICFLKK